MGGGENKLTGPDLKKGIAASELPDGGKLLGQADGEAVLLVRRGDEVFAVGATCTHYSGPLAEGLVIGHSVRCPWHHACFDLRTGESRGPALNAIACYRVEYTADKIIVAEKLVKGAGRPGGNEPATPLSSIAPPVTAKTGTAGTAGTSSSLPSSVVIIGGGAAGAVAAETLRREGYDGPVTLIGEDPSLPVDRPNLSKDYLAGTAPEEWMPLRSLDFYAEHHIQTRFATRVERIDVAGKQVTLAGGSAVPFGALLIATGATPTHLDITGADRSHVYYLRTLDDSRAIIAAIGTTNGRAKRAVVIGAGFIGLEVAASLRTRGLEVDVVAPDARPLERVLGAELGDAIQKMHEEHGVRFHLKEAPASIEADGVTLKSGGRILADFVVIGVGVRPNVGLAEQAGLKVDRGIVVNAHLETSAPGIYAAGDVARFPEARSGDLIRIEHWVVAERQGRAAAMNMLGAALAYDEVPFFWSQHYDVPIAYVGHAEKWDRIDVSGSAASRDCAVAFRRAGKTLAVATIYRDDVSLEAEAAMQRGDEAKLSALVPA